MDIPTKEHIPALLSAFDNSPFYAKFRSTRQEDLSEYAVRSVFHICGDGVLEDERYVTFMNGFAPHVHVRYLCFVPFVKTYLKFVALNSMWWLLVNTCLTKLHLQVLHIISLD